MRRPDLPEDPTLAVAGPAAFDERRADDRGRLARAPRRGSGSRRRSATRRKIFYTALYHALIKPCFAVDESPFWPSNGPFAFDICTMWDIYRTQLPLMTALFPARAVELANALLNVCEEEGNLPIGYRMAKGVDRFSRQGSALAQTFLADLCTLGRARDRLGLGARPHGQRPAPRVRRGVPAARGRAPGHPHPRPGLRLPLHRQGRPARRRRGAGRRSSRAWPPAGSTPSTPETGCSSTPPSTRAASGTTRSASCTTWRPGSTSPAARRRTSRCSTRSSASAPSPSRRSASGRASPSWRPATR